MMINGMKITASSDTLVDDSNLEVSRELETIEMCTAVVAVDVQSTNLSKKVAKKVRHVEMFRYFRVEDFNYDSYLSEILPQGASLKPARVATF